MLDTHDLTPVIRIARADGRTRLICDGCRVMFRELVRHERGPWLCPGCNATQWTPTGDLSQETQTHGERR